MEGPQQLTNLNQAKVQIKMPRMKIVTLGERKRNNTGATTHILY